MNVEGLMAVRGIRLDPLPSPPNGQQGQEEEAEGIRVPSPSQEDLGPHTLERTAKAPKFAKTYNAKWESNSLLKTWIGRHPRDNGKVVCRFCQSAVRAHKNDLLEHTRTLKHQRNFQGHSSPEEYNQFLVELKKVTNAIAKKRLTHPSGFPNSVSTTDLEQPSATITLITANGNAKNISLACHPYNNGMNTPSSNTPSPVMTTLLSSSTTSMSPGRSRDGGSSVQTNTSAVILPTTFLNLSTSSSENSGLEDLGLWNKDFMTGDADSPSDLVSVILEEEQQSPMSTKSNVSSSSTTNEERSSRAALLSQQGHGSVESLNTMILTGLSAFPTLNMNLSVLAPTPDDLRDSETNPSANVIPRTLLENESSCHPPGSTTPPSKEGNREDETLLDSPLLLSASHVITAIQEGRFSFSEICSIAKVAVGQIDRSINGMNGMNLPMNLPCLNLVTPPSHPPTLGQTIPSSPSTPFTLQRKADPPVRKRRGQKKE